MLPLEITPATLVVGLAVAVLALLAVRRLVRRGTCDSGGHCGGVAEGGCSGCSGCAAADRMLADMKKL